MSPKAPDKVVINDNESQGMRAAIESVYRSLNHLGNETLRYGWENETDAFRDEMIVACDEHHDADVKYYNALRGVVRKWAAFIDQKLDQQQSKP